MGSLGWTPKGSVFLFGKDGGRRLGLIVDERRFNAHGHDPSGGASSLFGGICQTRKFGSSESGPGQVQLGPRDHWTCMTSFHRSRIKPQLGRLFRLPSMSAGTFYVIEVEGRRVEPETQIWPHWLPTGFSVVAVLRARGSSELCPNFV